MKNYQLYKTNILLSGQVQWDLIVGIRDGLLYVKDFHLVPVSDYVPYNKYSDDSLLNYEHRYNLKDLYKKISGYFYSTPVNHYMNNDWPLIDKSAQAFDDTYLAGCKRLDYNIYKKPFGYLVPLWLEKLEDGENLAFKININSSNYKISSNILNLYSGDKRYPKSHQDFVRYFKNYIKYLNINKGCDDIINIDLTNQTAYLRGVDVTTGNLNICNLPNLVGTLISRERPLMEFDSIITNSFKENNTIIPNLFNFNICFDVSDILVGQASNQTLGKTLLFDIEAGITPSDNISNFTPFDKNDIYTNFNYIPKKFCNRYYNIDTDGVITDNTPTQAAPNVLDYLKDDKYIEFMNKNKVVQSICHWQLVDNNDYIFNLYDGFAGYSENSKTTHLYADTPNLTQDKYAESLNNTGWAVRYKIDFIKYNTIIEDFEKLKNTKYSTKLGRGWNNNIYYDYKNDNYIYVILGYIEDKKYEADIFSSVDNKRCFKYTDKKTGDSIIVNCLGYDSDFLFICSSNLDLLTFAGIQRILTRISNQHNTDKPGINNPDINKPEPGFGEIGIVKDDTYFTGFPILSDGFGRAFMDVGSYGRVVNEPGTRGEHMLEIRENEEEIDPKPLNNVMELINILKSIKEIPIVVLSKSLHISLADSPSMSTQEVEYYKNDNPGLIYVLRYDGKIKPCVGYGFNELFYKKYINPENILDSFKLYTNKGFQPLFKSIGFYSYESIKIDYNKPPKELTGDIEYKWFNNNMYLNLPSKLNFNINIPHDKNDLDNINNEISDKLKQLFTQSEKICKYILSKYNIVYNLIKYDNLKFEYEINMALK